MKDTINALLQIAQSYLQNYKGKRAMQAIEALMETQSIVKDLPPQKINRCKTEQLKLWEKVIGE